MAFITSRNPMAGREIKISVYGADGKPQEIALVAQYRRHKRKAFQALQEQLALIGKPVLDDAGQPTGAIHQPTHGDDIDFLKDVMGGWVGPQHADGSERVFSHDELDGLCEEWPELVMPLVNGFFEVHREAPRAKN